ncbi:MAG: hypothetical protein WCF23_11875 [Candidatus Nitrosopolaris sp.]
MFKNNQFIKSDNTNYFHYYLALIVILFVATFPSLSVALLTSRPEGAAFAKLPESIVTATDPEVMVLDLKMWFIKTKESFISIFIQAKIRRFR